jgi:hypothetical protein
MASWKVSAPAHHFQRFAHLVTTPEDANEPDDLSLVMSGRLGGYLWASLPVDHPFRPLLSQPYELIAARHDATVAAVTPLLSAWESEGLDTMLIKGFALAAFEYPLPGMRYYGDVDILTRDSPAQFTRRLDRAASLGWRSDGFHLQSQLWTHEVAHLTSPDGQVRIDVHRTATPWPGGRGRRAQVITDSIWERAVTRTRHGLTARVPSPNDHAVLLVLGRCWGNDQGGVKAFDALDLQLLMHNHGLTPAGLAHHATQLGGHGTWQAFTQVCAPWAATLTLDPALTRPIIDAGVRADRALKSDALRRSRLTYRAAMLPLLPRLLPDLAAAWAALRVKGDPQQHLRRWASQPARPAPPEDSLWRLIAAARLFTNALYPRQRRAGVCAARAYATFRVLRRTGYPAVFCSGVAQLNGAVLSHAWVEGPDGPLAAYGEPQNRQRYRLLFQYPPAPE